MAAKAPMRLQSMGWGRPEKRKKPEERLPPVGGGHEGDVDRDQEQEHDGQHRPGEVLEHPLDGAAEGQDEHHGEDQARW